MRTAAIAIIAFNRFRRITSHPSYYPLYGIPVRIGSENIALAPASIVSHANGIHTPLILSLIYAL